MAEPNAHINYSLSDIERYFSGSMTPQEMHALEKAALHDPFLADAMEGYQSVDIKEAENDLNQIHASIFNLNAKDEHKIVPLKKRSFAFWRVAVAVFVLAIAGVSGWYLLDNNNHNHQIASQDKEESPSQVSQVNPVIGNNEEPVPTQTLPPASVNRQENTAKTNNNNIVANDGFKDIVPQTKTDSLIHTEDIVVIGYAKEESKRAIAADAKKPAVDTIPVIPSAVVMAKAKEVNVPNASTSNFKLYDYRQIVDDSSKVVTKSLSDSYALQKQNWNYASNTTNINQLSRRAEAQADVVSIGKSRQQKKNNKNTVTETTDSSSSVYPSIGWQSFEEYVYNKLHKQLDTTRNGLDVYGSDIALEFKIDEKGVPKDFKVLRSINNEVDSQAIEIIKKGPRWITRDRKKKGKVVIKL